MTYRLVLYAILGFALGLSMRITTEAQQSRLIFGSDSATATSQVITSSSNALRVLGK